MKKLSPSEPYIIINMQIYCKATIPISRLGRIIEKNYGYVVELNPPYMLTVRTRYRSSKLNKIYGDLKELFDKIIRYIDSVCIELYIYTRDKWSKIRQKLINGCNKYSDSRRELYLCFNSNEVYYLMYNRVRKYLTIRPIPLRINMNDPLLIPKTLFRRCGSPEEVISYSIKCLNSIQRYLQLMMNALSKDPLGGDEYKRTQADK